MFLTALFVVFVSLAPVAQAATPYYEFNPDYAQSLLVASTPGTIEELFIPINEHLAGVDLWLSTGGQEGALTVALLRNSTQVATRTISLPAIEDSESGTRVHIGFPSQVGVSSPATYTLRIASALPSLRLYWGEQNTLVAHNGNSDPSFAGGRARIGGEDRDFSFKFALYETTESAPPVLTSVSVQQVTTGQATILFYANEPVDASVTYSDIVTSYTGQYTSCVTGIAPCSVLLPVHPGASYNYTMTVKDVWGNTSTHSGEFVALGTDVTPTPVPTSAATPTPTPLDSPTPTPDVTKPVITNARVAISAPTSLGFAWTTSKASNSTVVVQLTPVLITVGGNSDATLELEHFVTVGGLTPDTYYAVRITSADTWGNVASTSLTVLTPKQAPAPEQTPSAPLPIQGSATPTPATIAPITASAESGATQVSWTAPATTVPEEYRIDVFDAQQRLVKSITVPKDTVSTRVEGLDEGDHRVVVYAQHDGIYEKVSTPATTRVQRVSLLERIVLYAPMGIAITLGIVVLGLAGVALNKRRTKAQTPQPTPPPVVPTAAPPQSAS